MIEFKSFIPEFKMVRNSEILRSGNKEPFNMPLFSLNLFKKYIVLQKYKFITKELQRGGRKRKTLDFGTGFGAMLPISSSISEEVIAVDAYDDQIRAANALVNFLKLDNVKVIKVEKENGLSRFKDQEFDLILALDVLEHNVNYKSIILGLKRVLKPEGLIIVSLPSENFIYRLFARREVEKDAERGHVYHSKKGFLDVSNFININLKLVKSKNIYGFIYIYFLKK
ncbi:MAG: class I SAM-dependent methyltransferase [Caldisphaera sp.]